MPSKTLHRILSISSIALLLAACGSDDEKNASEKRSPSSSDETSSSSSKETADSSKANAASSGEAKPSDGCIGYTSLSADLLNEKRTLPDRGTDREYLLTVPAAVTETKPAPVVVDIHGLLEGDQIHSAMSKFSELGIREGFIVITPNGSGTPLGWNAKTEETNPDLLFLDAVLKEVNTNFCVDTSRVYATGLSNGAIMSSTLACVRPTVYAAVAPVAGVASLDNCASNTPVPVLATHGTKDPILGFNGGADLSGILPAGDGNTTSSSSGVSAEEDLTGPGYPANVAQWAARNGCNDSFTDTELPDGNDGDATSVIHRVYDCPGDATPTEFDIVIGAGHSWPGSEFSKSIEPVVGPTTFDYNATEAIWEFFTRFHL